jgi:Mg2+ and Co2+ transporter CorA
MIPEKSSGTTRLFKLLDKIIGEEQGFKANSRKLLVPSENNNADQQRAADDCADRLDQFRQAHEAIFQVHRRFINDHELMIQRCFVISRQARAGLLTETEIAMELERLQDELRRLKAEHKQTEQESRKLLDKYSLSEEAPEHYS